MATSLRIIWITPDVPYPLNTGANIAIYNRIRQMYRRGHKVSLFSFGWSKEIKKADFLPLREICENVVVYSKRPTWQTLAKFCLGRSTPFRILRRPANQLCDDVEAAMAQQRVDIVQVESPAPMGALFRQKGRNAYALFYNFISLAHEEFERIARHLSPWSPLGPVYRAETRREKAATFELLKLDAFDRYLFVSNTERRTLAGAFPHLQERMITVPIGLDLHRLSTTKLSSDDPAEEASQRMLFFGTFENMANQDAVRWFVNAILPRVLKECPKATLTVVGKGAAKHLGGLESRSVRVYSDVEDLSPYLARADVCVLPLRGGGGVRVKLLEAIAAKKVVVTTSLGADGTPFSHGEHLLIANTAEEFAHCCVSALANPARLNDMVERAHAVLKENYSCEAVGEQIEGLYLSALAQARG